MKVENASLSLWVCWSNSSLCNELHKSLQITKVVKAEGNCKKKKGLDAGNKREQSTESRV